MADKETIATYNQQAQKYDQETTDFWERFPQKIFPEFINHLKPGSVLDVGSGPGRDAELLKKHGLDPICLDASSAMVAITQAKGLTSIQADFLNLPFDNSTFTGVWSYTSLLHVPKNEIDIALGEITRVLNPDGIFGLGMIEGDSEGYRTSSGMDQPRYFSYYQKDELYKHLDQAGFKPFYFETFQPGSKNYLHILARKK